MTSASTQFLKEAPTVWRHLNGIVCLYKPHLGAPFRKELKHKLCQDLNSMKVRRPEEIIEIRRIEGSSPDSKLVTRPPKDRQLVSVSRDGPDTIQILKGPSYADHPLVVGPRYQEQDIKVWDVSQLGVHTSGLLVAGINKGTAIAQNIYHMRWLRAYVVSGRFGISTDNNFHTGRIVEKSTYHRLKRSMLERLLSSSQASHQRAMFLTTGLGLTTELSYELASKGLMRPAEKTSPVIYGLKCLNFDLPNFDIEIHVINETEDFLQSLIRDFGLRLHTTATCTKLRCIKYGPFTLEDALLKKHWDLQNIMNNLGRTREVLKDFDLTQRDPLITSESLDMKPAPRMISGSS